MARCCSNYNKDKATILPDSEWSGSVRLEGCADICNGSILLREGKEDRTWTEESIRISETSQPDYIKAYKLAIDLAGEDAIISADPFMFYIKTDQTEIVF